MKIKSGKNLFACLGLVLVLSLFGACKNDSMPNLARVPMSIGSLNHITVVADTTLIQGAVGDSILAYYGASYPVLPQEEPVFDMQLFSTRQFLGDAHRQHLRTLLFIADLSDKSSEATQEVLKQIGNEKALRAKEDSDFFSVVGEDKWSKNQIVMYVFGYGKEALAKNVVRAYPAIARKVRENDFPMLKAQTYIDGHNQALARQMQEKFGFYMDFPADYRVAKESEKSVWLRKETQNLSSNFLIYKIPYTNKNQLSNEYLKTIRDTLGRQYISSTIQGSYMRTNSEDLPVLYKNKTIANNFAIEARGIWELEGDFMGGPFMSYLIHDSSKNELLFIDAFIHAPGTDKRDYMQHIELIFSSLKL